MYRATRHFVSFGAQIERWRAPHGVAPPAADQRAPRRLANVEDREYRVQDVFVNVRPRVHDWTRGAGYTQPLNCEDPLALQPNFENKRRLGVTLCRTNRWRRPARADAAHWRARRP